MCIAIYCRPGAAPLSRETLENCWYNNPDGMGLAYARDGQLHVYHSLLDFDELYQHYLESIGHPCVLHFRIATHGSVSVANCHPFVVPNTDNQIVLVHNGILQGLSCVGDESDTRAFCRLLGTLPTGWWDEPAIHELMAGYANPSKMVLLHADGSVLLVNEHFGQWNEDVWFSNDSYKTCKWTSGVAGLEIVGYVVKYQNQQTTLCPTCLPPSVPIRWENTITVAEAKEMDTPWCDWCNHALVPEPKPQPEATCTPT